MDDDLQSVVTELTATKAIIEILAPLPVDTRRRVVAWLQGVVSPPVVPAPIAAPQASAAGPRMETSGAGPASTPPVARIATRLAQLGKEELQAPGADENDDEPRSLWRKKQG